MIRTRTSTVTESAYTGVGIATLIVGGLAIYHLSSIFPIPGVKYIFMAPYLSMVIFIMMTKINHGTFMIKFGLTFGLVMTLMNLYMGLSIIVTSLLTHLTISPISRIHRPYYGSILFSTYAGISALFISKIMIGGVFLRISPQWILITGCICFAFGTLGTLLAKNILKHMVA